MSTMNEPLTSRDDAWAKRLEGLLPVGIASKRIAIIGCSSVGSFIADELARGGIRNFLLIDPDIVEWPNLTRTIFGYRDIGKPKVIALAEHLRRIFPDLAIHEEQSSIQEIKARLADMLTGIDLVIAAVDDPAANGMINRYCYALGIRSAFIGIYKGAKGGEVIFIDPNSTPCFHCATGGLRDALSDTQDIQSVQPNRDYQTNRLVGEIALGADIHFVCCAATKIVLSMLSSGEKNATLANFAQVKLEDGGNYLMLGMEPSYFLFPSTHEKAIGQYAFQAIWAKATRRETCTVCGIHQHRETPL